MGIYIDMEMPEHCGYCRFRYDGICHALQKTQYSKEECPLVPVPPHGRLGDLGELSKELKNLLAKYPPNSVATGFLTIFASTVDLMPTIIPVEGEIDP